MQDALSAGLADTARAVQAALKDALADLPPGDLTDAMRYAVAGGKRLRAYLVLESARLHDVPDSAAMPVAVGVEMLHAYSLVHDDLPAMDDDDLRRGMPTVHVKWGEATAILAGDALQSAAFGMLSRPDVGDGDVRVTLISRLAEAVGARGMVWGQALDIAAETATSPLDLAAITQLQANKTGALIEFAATAGAVLAKADPQPLTDYARDLGLAFQIADDLLDVTGTTEATGKRVGKDADAGKATFVSLLGQDGARARAAQLSDRAQNALAPYGDAPAAENLRALARFVIHRQT
ncbi:MAG: farnesyl-diphosphate synthase [Paracoccus denitrificans]|nr:MAG: farnesyl-diphosphate synthase [Paracoccus denitrificans]PZO85601.1 MAG: farnesyl-diphosphate synthase [Paracoccus denitrificans]